MIDLTIEETKRLLSEWESSGATEGMDFWKSCLLQLLATMHREERLREALTQLVERIEINGGIGEYKGGQAFIMEKVRKALSNEVSDNG